MPNFQPRIFKLAIAGAFTFTTACTAAQSQPSTPPPGISSVPETPRLDRETRLDSAQSFPGAVVEASSKAIAAEAPTAGLPAPANDQQRDRRQSPLEAMANAETVAEAGTVAEPSPTVPIPCLTWQAHQKRYGTDTPDTYVLPLLPNMPEGFRTGCTVLEIMGMADVTYILRTGIEVNRILYPTALEEVGEGGVVFAVRGDRIDADALEALIASGDVITYYAACTTTGRQASYCNGYPQYLPYALPRPFSPPNAPDKEAACFQGYCLESETISADELADLWDYWQAPVPAENQAVRNQYATVPLDTIFPEPRSVMVPSSKKETLAIQALGRTTLEEGEEPSVVIDEGRQGDFNAVTLVNQGLADDSIGGYRYRIEFESFDGDHVIPVWIGQQQFCQRTQAWTPALCP